MLILQLSYSSYFNIITNIVKVECRKTSLLDFFAKTHPILFKYTENLLYIYLKVGVLLLIYSDKLAVSGILCIFAPEIKKWKYYKGL